MKLFLAAIALGLGASTATAGWQETEWGMSVDEVQGVFESAAPSDNPKYDFKGLQAQLRGPYSIDGIDGIAAFGFRDQELRAVNVSFQGRSECLQIQSLAHKAYGEPKSHQSALGISLTIWSDTENGNTMSGTWGEVEGSDRMLCVLTYEPLVTPGQSGGI